MLLHFLMMLLLNPSMSVLNHFFKFIIIIVKAPMSQLLPQHILLSSFEMCFLMQFWQELLGHNSLERNLFYSWNRLSSFVPIGLVLMIAHRRVGLVKFIEIQERDLRRSAHLVVWGQYWGCSGVWSCCFVVFTQRLESYWVLVNILLDGFEITSQISYFIDDIRSVIVL